MSDVKRADLIVPYKHTPSKPRGEASSVISQSLPMAAMFMKNKMLSWAALFLAIQSFLNEPVNKPVNDSSSSQPPLLRIVFAFISLGTCYLDLIFPATNPAFRKAVTDATETATSIVSAATASK